MTESRIYINQINQIEYEDTLVFNHISTRITTMKQLMTDNVDKLKDNKTYNNRYQQVDIVVPKTHSVRRIRQSAFSR